MKENSFPTKPYDSDFKTKNQWAILGYAPKKGCNGVTMWPSVEARRKGSRALATYFLPSEVEASEAALLEYKAEIAVRRRRKRRIEREQNGEKMFTVRINSKRKATENLCLFFDVDTNDRGKSSVHEEYTGHWPRIVQLAWVLTDAEGKRIGRKHSAIIKPNGFCIPPSAIEIHGITPDMAQKKGKRIETVMEQFLADVEQCNMIVCHNASQNVNVVRAELWRLGLRKKAQELKELPCICTMKQSTSFCKLPLPWYSDTDCYKWPKLQELHEILFGGEYESAHDAASDVEATMKCFFELKKRGVIE